MLHLNNPQTNQSFNTPTQNLLVHRHEIGSLKVSSFTQAAAEAYKESQEFKGSQARAQIGVKYKTLHQKPGGKSIRTHVSQRI